MLAADVPEPSSPTKSADLAPTALYTAGVWTWARMPGAELLGSKDTETARKVVTAALWVAGLFLGRRPSLRHSLVQRHVMLDRLVEESGARCVLEIASGLSARGIRFSAGGGRTYVEIDAPLVVAKKRELLARTAEGETVLARPNLRLVGGDVVGTPLEALLPAGTAPDFVVAEGILVYLSKSAREALFASARRVLGARGGTFAFDLVPASEEPKPGVVGRVLGWLMKRLTRGGDFVRDRSTRESLDAELRAAGFESVRVIEPRAAPPEWQVPHLETFTQQVVFAAKAGGGEG